MSSPIFVTDSAGVRFRVADLLSGPPDVPWTHIRIVAAGHPRAYLRLFEAPDGAVYAAAVARDPWGDRRLYCPDARDLAARRLRAQLAEARRYPPDTWCRAMLADARDAARTGRQLPADRAIALERRLREAPPDPSPAPDPPSPRASGLTQRERRGGNRR